MTRRYLIYFTFILFAAFGLIVFSGCFGSKAPERTYYSIDYALGTQPTNANPKYHKTVVIQNITTALAYDRQEIVYRANPYEFQYYWYRLWASKPRKMLRELIVGHLRYTNLFSSVTSTIEDKLPDYLLDIEISSIEELDVSDTEWYAHLGLRFTLQTMDMSQTVWTYTFDSKIPVASNQPVYVVKAMSELLNTELVKAFQNLDQKLASSTPIRESSPAPQTAIDFTEEPDTPQDSTDADVPRATLKNRP